MRCSINALALSALALAAGAASAADTDKIVFGMADFQATPPGGWQLMSGADFSTYQGQFVS
jgi:hypothetical protein